MAGQPTIAATAAHARGAAQVRARNGFFFWASLSLLLFVLIGFAPTLYLRAFFGIPVVEFLSGIVWGNFAGIVAFSVLVLAAILLRGRSQVHKRLMLLASIAIIGPALARIARWTVWGGEDSAFVPVVALALLGAVVVNDLVSTRRVHRATLIGVALVLLLLFGSQLIAQSELGQSVVRALG